MKRKTPLPEVKRQFTAEDILRLANRAGKLKFVYAIGFQRLLDESYGYGLDTFFDDELFNDLSERPEHYTFRAIEVRGGKLVIQVCCDVKKTIAGIKEEERLNEQDLD